MREGDPLDPLLEPPDWMCRYKFRTCARESPRFKLGINQHQQSVGKDEIVRTEVEQQPAFCDTVNSFPFSRLLCHVQGDYRDSNSTLDLSVDTCTPYIYIYMVCLCFLLRLGTLVTCWKQPFLCATITYMFSAN